jgi:hypothetical protein
LKRNLEAKVYLGNYAQSSARSLKTAAIYATLIKIARLPCLWLNSSELGFKPWAGERLLGLLAPGSDWVLFENSSHMAHAEEQV